MASMVSAPATIPATRAPTFTSGFDPAEPGTRTWVAVRSCSPARSARVMTGIRPAHDTRFGSSKPADSIDDMDLLRHGGMGRVLTAGRAPSTLGTFLRAFTFGHVRQLDAVASRVLVNLAGRAPLLVGADQVAFLDIDDTIKATYGHKKQGAGYGYSKAKGLNALLAIVSTPVSAPCFLCP